MKKAKKLAVAALAGTLLVSSAATMIQTDMAEAEAKEKGNKKDPTNVIMLVMDGSSDNVSTLSRWYKGESLALDEILTGGARTYSAESAITDSAPAATALATGHKSNSGYVGILPSSVTTPGAEQIKEEDAFKPVANVLEGAKQSGRATGIVSTSEIQHATPAGFSSHVTSRSNYDDIAEQQVYQGIDVVLGGGLNSLKETRKDGENLLEVLEEQNYELITTREELLKTNADKIWGSFAPAALAYDFDREHTKAEEPTLADMTKKAIDTLNKDKDGFFLMVEGSKIDWAAHANDAVGMISDFLAFDDAVKEALEFAKKDKNTLVIAVTDHGNSGITMGNIATTGTYDTTPVSAYIDPLKEATMTVEGALSVLKEDKSNLEEVAALYGLKNLTDKERTALETSEKLAATMTKLLAERANIGYTTGGHTGDDVFLYAYGPNKPTGLVENTDLANIMAETMGFKLDQLTSSLYIDAKPALEKKGFKVTIDQSDSNNPVLVAQKGNTTYEMPENKNTILSKTTGKDGKTEAKQHTVPYVTVYNDSSFYISEEALKYMK
ncbi:alkaline phosphatase [Lysinibacillus sp. 3P01SB]|uniref:alkaline phosphatase n=1 Tax=Lysinibacillus sp. 3P01SB TaxID=3132284 RepID=UPI0039A45F35